MLFSDPALLDPYFAGKRVAIVGSGPGSLDNAPGFVDGHDVVVRVNNYKTGEAQGFRTDVFYSFFGGSITKPAEHLKADGVKLCLCKCPNNQFIESEWHRKNGKQNGVDFRYIYERRAGWWFCPTFVPRREWLLDIFEGLQRHIPTTGFAAVLAVLQCRPESVYLTGFDFFASAVHNVNEPWRPGNPADPIGHAPHLERAWLREIAKGASVQITFDPKLKAIMESSDADGR